MRSRSLALAVLASVVVTSCGGPGTAQSGASGEHVEASSDTDPVESAEASLEGWDVQSPTIPAELEVDVVDGGLILNSYRGADRFVVTHVYASEHLDRIVRTYDRWVEELNGSKGRRSLDVGVTVVWSEWWTADRSEVRMTECLSRQSGEFDRLCVALTTWVGSGS